MILVELKGENDRLYVINPNYIESIDDYKTWCRVTCISGRTYAIDMSVEEIRSVIKKGEIINGIS